jgi:death-on-curing protein
MRLKWITVAMATAIHDEAIYEFGGLPGARDPAALESALARPRNLLAHEPDSTIFAPAAALCVGLSGNHAFNDGNKRTSLLLTRALLYLNGLVFEPRQEDEVACMVAIAAGQMQASVVEQWLAEFSEPNPR